MDSAELVLLLPSYLLHLPRCSLAIALIPMFSAKFVPGMARGGLVASLLLIPVFGLAPASMPSDGLALGALIAREVAIGFAIGLAFSLIFWIAQTVGQVIDHQTGLTYAQNIDPSHGNQVSVTGSFLDRVMVSYLVAAGGVLVMVDTLYLSYEIWPVSQTLPSISTSWPMLLAAETHRLFAFALLLAAPVLLVLFIFDLGFGLVGRTSPTINVFGLTLPMKSSVALMVLFFSLPFVLDRAHEALQAVRGAFTLILRSS